MEMISIIIVHYNTVHLLKKQLAALSVDPDLSIIIIDNFSTEETTKKVKELAEHHQQHHNVLLITNHNNPGFATSCNQGSSWARSEWLLFLNPDVLITPEAVKEMIAAAKREKLDAASPTPTSENYRKPIPTPLSLLAEFTPLKYLIKPSHFTQKTLTGGCLLIRKKVLLKIGGWDERFFLWFEDSDLTKRLYDQNYSVGWLNIPHVHSGGASLKKLSEDNQRYLFFGSMKTYAKKYFGPIGRSVVSLLCLRFAPSKP